MYLSLGFCHIIYLEVMILSIAINNDNKLKTALTKIVGQNNILSEVEERYCYSFDATNIFDSSGIADFVVFPTSTQEVSEILKLANDNNIAVVPRCAGTNHVGGCIPKNGGIILSFAKMNRILEINQENLYCKVEPGVVIADLKEAVGKTGLFYPPDPSNYAVSMVGGSIALSSGGPTSFKYGTTKDYILDLEVVLADGTVINTGSPCAKNVTGYNLTQLFVGSEGTLGIVTQATIKLIPKPEAKRVMLAYFKSLEDAANTVNSIISHLITPAVIDLLDKNTLSTIEQFCPSGLLTDQDAALLIEIDGYNGSLDSQYEKIIAICNDNQSSHIQTAKNQEESDKIWTARRSSFGATAKLAPVVVTEDVVVPRENITKLVTGIQEICKRYSIKVCIMGHIGDGNIHPNMALDPRNEEELKNYKKTKAEIYNLTISLKGTLSGEHGIGSEKSAYLAQAISQKNIDYMKQIKKIFDPKNTLNPGKIF